MRYSTIPETPSSASLNRVRIVDLPGLPLEDAVVGRRADELLSSRALLAFAAPFAADLGLAADGLSDVPPQLTRSDVGLRIAVPQAVNLALASAEPARRAAAESVARRLGRNLGWLLITLRRGDVANRDARPDWGPGDWARWANIESVWLAGGLSTAPLGLFLVREARMLLAELGYARPAVTLSPYGSMVAMIGAGRLAGSGFAYAQHPMPRDRTVLAFDFGHTLVKRAALTFSAGQLVEVDCLPALPTDWASIYPENPNPQTLGQKVLEFLTEIIAEATAERSCSVRLALISLAAYRQRGRLLGNGPYAMIQAVAGDRLVEPFLSEALSIEIGQPWGVQVLHDGTAASLAHAGSPNSAVIVLGTALGVGFPPASDAGLCPVAI